ncbi:MAG TPA: UDP-N-acetylglucosamine 2-epimerase (non-hydrolyzing) [Syntrophorhabdaceae bacterium]|jgi:UDP-N-acetylglucosamine 2-epimerase (non-hydrolysing)
MKIFLVAGARPNFVKIAPIIRALVSQRTNRLRWKIVHTGQHYDYDMSEAFFEDLEIPRPDYYLNAGSGTHADQTARIMIGFEKVCEKDRPDIVIVVGDVNSTLACSIVAKKDMIRVAHVEAGLRSGDMGMPEEINRIVTDSVSNYFFVTEKSAINNLLKEGKQKKDIFFVGHVMVDNLYYQIRKLKASDSSIFPTSRIKDKLNEYAFLTLHRPSNVDDPRVFGEIIEALNQISDEMPILFPVHPRTRKQLDIHNLKLGPNVTPLSPLGFKESLFLWKDANFVLTDSGGLQEETTALGVPCFTVRENTERPITIDEGTNTLIGTGKGDILRAFRTFQKNGGKRGTVPALWDGCASERIVDILLKLTRDV